MTIRVFSDYSVTTLSAGISSSATACTVVALSSVGPPAYSFPPYVAGNVFTATLLDAATQKQVEQVLVTNWNVGTNQILAMTRGVNGTTAKAYLAGDSFLLYVVAGTDNQVAFKDQITSQQTPSGAIDGANATYTITQAPLASGITYVVNGIIQELGVDYSITGTTITKLGTLLSGTDRHFVMPYFY